MSAFSTDAALRAMGEGVIVTDIKGRVIATNPAAEAFTGKAAVDCNGKDLADVLYALRAQDRTPAGNIARDVLNGAERLDLAGQFLLISSGGTERRLGGSVSPLPDGRGRLTGAVVTFHDVSESEHRYRALFKGMTEGFALHEIIRDDSGEACDYRFLDLNPAFERLIGMKREEVIGKTRGQVLPNEDPRWITLYGEVALTGRSARFDNVTIGSDRHYNVLVYCPEPGQFAALFLDISERRKAEAALLESETTLRAFVNAIPESAFLFRTDGTVLAANETVARRLGKHSGDLIGASIYDLLPREVAVDRRKRIEEVIRSGVPVHFLDARLGRYIDNFLYPVTDEHGNVTRVAVLGIDVTERKQSEDKVKEQAMLLDIAADAILVCDMEDRVLYWNRSAEKVYGWTAEDTLGKNATELLFAGSNAAEPVNALAIVMEKGEWAGEFHQVSRDGSELLVQARWTLVRDEQGKPKGVLSFNADFTQHRSIEAQLRRAQRLESLGTLAGGIAHDLNNVLSPILMGVEGLAIQKSDEMSRKIISIIKTSAQRGADIVRQVLSFARGIEGEKGEVQLKHVLREIEGIVRETFPRSIALHIDVPRDLSTVLGEATQLHQVLMNLCVNARDAMPDGGVLTLSAENVQLDEAYARMHIDAKPIRYVLLKVEDTGTGMPPAVIEKIFDPFFSTKDPGKGTGLGLATALSIVKSHGGFINVYSEVRKGSSFKVYLPAAEEAAGGAPEEVGEGIPMGEGELILVVDDEAAVRDISRQILESFGYQVLTAGDGTEALALLVQRKGEIQTMITDMMMPYMDGTATIRAARKVDPALRIVVTSGLMGNGHTAVAVGGDVQAFLAKPFTADTLLRTLRKVLSGASPMPPA